MHSNSVQVFYFFFSLLTLVMYVVDYVAAPLLYHSGGTPVSAQFTRYWGFELRCEYDTDTGELDKTGSAQNCMEKQRPGSYQQLIRTLLDSRPRVPGKREAWDQGAILI